MSCFGFFSYCTSFMLLLSVLPSFFFCPGSAAVFMACPLAYGATVENGDVMLIPLLLSCSFCVIGYFSLPLVSVHFSVFRCQLLFISCVCQYIVLFNLKSFIFIKLGKKLSSLFFKCFSSFLFSLPSQCWCFYLYDPFL